jgi:hypothetical protein
MGAFLFPFVKVVHIVQHLIEPEWEQEDIEVANNAVTTEDWAAEEHQEKNQDDTPHEPSTSPVSKNQLHRIYKATGLIPLRIKRTILSNQVEQV